MSLSINKNKFNSSVFSAFQPKNTVVNTLSATNSKGSIYSTLAQRRNHRIEELDRNKKIITAGVSIGATLLPMIYFAKKQNGLKKITDLFKINYGLKEVLSLSTSSILGGVLAGIAVDKKTNKKRKINEGVFQFMNATIPTALVGGALELVKDNVKYQNSKTVKIAAIVTALVAGMPLAAWLSNLINDPKDKDPDRKLTLKDAVINMDDAIGALVVAKIPFIEQLHLDKLMPAIFSWCGYRAGQSN